MRTKALVGHLILTPYLMPLCTDEHATRGGLVSPHSPGDPEGLTGSPFTKAPGHVHHGVMESLRRQ